jgi:MFS family permease
MWSLVAAAYVVVFMQRVAPPAILDKLMVDYGANVVEIGLVTSAYFYGYMLMQMPAGVIVDRWGVRRAVLGSLTVSGIGTLWFASTTVLAHAGIARALVAMGDALIFTALIKLTTQWFGSRRFGLMSGLSQVCGYVGGLLATTPLALALARLTWREIFTMLAWTIFANLALSGVVLRDPDVAPAERSKTVKEVIAQAARALTTWTDWAPLISSLGNYVVFASLSGAWGIPLFMQGYGLDRGSASVPMFVFLAGYAAGSLVFGHLADAWFKTLRRPLIVMAVARIALLAALAPAIGLNLPFPAIIVIVATFGLMGGGTTPLLLSCVRLTYPGGVIGAVVGFNTTLVILGTALAVPLLGWVLHQASGSTSAVPGAVAHTWLVMTLAVLSLPSAVGPWFIVDKDRPRSLERDARPSSSV